MRPVDQRTREPPRGDRPYAWTLTAFFVLLAGVGLLLATTLGSLRIQTAVQVLLDGEARWSLEQSQALGHLTAYALDGDPSLLERYHASLAYPRAVRPALRVAVDRPGDHEAVAEVLARSPLTRENIAVIGTFIRFFGTSRTTQEALRLWLDADRHLQELEAAAEAVIGRVEESGPASEPVLEQLGRIHALDRDLQNTGRRFAPAINAWVDTTDRWIRGTIIGISLVIVLGGLVVFLTINRKLATSERVRREVEARFRQVTEAIDEVFWLTDPAKQQMLYISPAYESVWGRSRDELIRNPDMWLKAVVPVDRPRVEAALPLQERGEYELEYRIHRPNGEIRWIHDRGFPVKNDAGTVFRVAGIAEDITERRKLQEEIVRARSFRSVSRLAASLSHEFNNLLTALQNHLYLALMELDDSQTAREDMETMIRLLERGGTLTHRLLSLSGQQHLVPRSVPMERFFQENRSILRSSLPAGVELEVEVDGDPPPAFADPEHLQDVFLILVAVAGREVEPEGRVGIRIARLRTSESTLVHGASLPRGEYVRVAISDSGPPFDAEDVDRMFDPGTVEDAVDVGGSSLGLAAVFGILRQSQGGIQVPASDTGDERFVVLLPRHEAEENNGDRELPSAQGR